jgi:DNA-binding MarR family transcriptional regulator
VKSPAAKPGKTTGAPKAAKAPAKREPKESVRVRPAIPLLVDPSAPAVDGEPFLRAEQCIALLQRRLIKPMSRGGPRGDLTLTQYHALSFLAARGQASVSELKDILGVAQSTTSVLVDKLGRMGLVEKQRDGRDHRLACVVPLPKGLRMVQRYRKNAERNLLALAAVLGDDAVREVFVALERALVATAPLEDPRVLRAVTIDDGSDGGGDNDSLDLDDDAALEAAE